MEQLLLIKALIRRHADTHTKCTLHIYTIFIQFIIACLYSEGITLVKNSNELTLTW